MTPSPYIPFPVPRDRIPLAYAYRSTMLRSTVAILQHRGLYDAYVAALAPAHRDAILATVTGAWLSAEVAMAHYEACDHLGLSEMEQASIGWETSRRFHGPVLMTALRAMGAVSSPWAATSLVHRTWGRVWRGSAIAVSKIASIEAILELAGWPPSRVPYARVAFRGAVRGAIEYFCRRAQVTDVPDLCTDLTIGLHVVWY
ncbi:MAG TPA: hypothetical protein VF765_24600 [Polyangiaceae bacterium]